MGIWKMMKTKNDIADLETVMSAPIPAWRAPDLLNTILGCDSLFDHFVAAGVIDKGADVRSLIVNRIDQLYFTQSPPEEVCDIDVAEALRKLVESFKIEEGDIFHQLCKLDADTAKAQVMWALDDNDGDPARYSISRDGCGMDYIAVSPDDKVFRVEAIDGCVLSFHPDPASRYHLSDRGNVVRLH